MIRHGIVDMSHIQPQNIHPGNFSQIFVRMFVECRIRPLTDGPD